MCRGRRVAIALVAGVVLASSTAACSWRSRGPDITAPSTITLSSSVAAAGGHLPTRYSCRGTGEPIPVDVRGLPASTVELAVIVEDPDAPRGTFTHWVVYGVPAATGHLDLGTVPLGGVLGARYVPPCPPGDDSHHYELHVYALRQRSGLRAGEGAAAVRRAIAPVVVAQGRLVLLFP